MGEAAHPDVVAIHDGHQCRVLSTQDKWRALGDVMMSMEEHIRIVGSNREDGFRAGSGIANCVGNVKPFRRVSSSSNNQLSPPLPSPLLPSSSSSSAPLVFSRGPLEDVKNPPDVVAIHDGHEEPPSEMRTQKVEKEE